MAMSIFYNILKPKQAKKTLPHAKTESIITQVQKPGTDSTQSTPTIASTPTPTNASSVKNLLTIGKCIPVFVANCLSRRRETLFRDEESVQVPSLLAKQSEANKGRKTLVLDLDETLVHSSFDNVKNADMTMSLDIKGTNYNFKVMIRPGTEEFLEKACEVFEVVIFTASLMEYATAIMQRLHKKELEYTILAREHCTNDRGVYVKDLTRLGRNLKDVILVDNSPNAFRYQPENAYHIKDFFDCKKDRELYILTSCLEYLNQINDVRPIKTHRLVYESKASSTTSTPREAFVSSRISLSSPRNGALPILKTDGEIIQQVKVSPKNKQCREVSSSSAEAEALSIIRSLVSKQKGFNIVKPQQVRTELIVAKTNTDVSTATAGKSSKEELEEIDNIDELIIRTPVPDNDDELDINCKTESDGVSINLARDFESTESMGRGTSGSESGSDNGEAKDTDERMYYAIEARAC